MRLDDFLYFLLDANGRPLVGNTTTGQVQVGSKDTLLGPDGKLAKLRKTPEGWRDVLVKYGRSAKYFGLFRDFTTPMKFVGDGAMILRDIYWKKGIEGYAKLVIIKNDRSTWPEKHKTWYIGEIDFSKFKQDKYGAVTVNVMEGGLSKLFKANENKVVNIPIDEDPEHIQALLDGINLYEKGNFALADSTLLKKSVVSADFYPPFVFLNSEGTSTGIVFRSQNTEIVNFGDPFNENWCAAADPDNAGPVELTIKGRVRFRCNTDDVGDTHIMRLWKSTMTAPELNDYILFTSPCDAGNEYTYDIDETISLDPDEKLYLEGKFGTLFPSGVEVEIEYLEGSELTISFKNKYQPTIIKGLYLYRVFQKITELITDGKYTIKSDWLQAKKDIMITCGDSIRGIIADTANNVAGPVIRTSISDLFQFLLSRWSVGLGIENDKLVIEPIAYFFPTTNAIALGQVDDCEFVPAEDLLFNTIKAGYENVEYNNTNGKSEVNSGQQWGTPVTRVVREQDMKSPYRADPYGIEFLRINLDGKTTTDDSSDNDVFAINIETQLTVVGSDQYYKLNRPAYSSITGVMDAEGIFNVELSPKRGLLNNGPWLHSLLDGLDSGVIKLDNADKNKELATTLAGLTIIEKEDIDISHLGSRLALPHYATFTTSVPLNVPAVLKTTPYYQVSFIWKSVTWNAFLWDGGIKPATNDKQQWKMLLSANNDVTKLINV